MSSIVDQAKVYVTLDGRDAETVMAELTAKTEKYTKALTDAYQAGDKLSMKNALKDLKDTEKELTNVQKQTFDVTKVMQNLNGTNLKDLKRAQSEITGELNKMARGTDEFTSKASDLQKVTAEIKKMQTEMKGSGEKGGGPFDRIKEIFTGVGLVEVAKKGLEMFKENFKEIVESTKTGADKFEFATAGMKSGLDYFYKTLSTGDWSNFLDNMEKAIKAGYDYAKAMDEVRERTIALSLKESDALKENIQLELDLRNKTLSPEERLAAGEKRIAKEEELTKQRTEIAQKEYDAQLKLIENRTGLSEKQLEDITKYNHEELRSKAEEYNELLDMEKMHQTAMTKYIGINQMSSATMEAENLKKVQEEMKKYSPEAISYAKALSAYGTAAEKMIVDYAGAYVKLNQAEVSGKENIKKVYSKVNELRASMADEAEKEAKKQAEKELAEADAKNNKLIIAEKQRYIKGETDSYAYNQNLLKLDDKASQDRIAILRKYASSSSELQKKLNDEEIKQSDRKLGDLVKQRQYRDEVLKLGSSLIEAENKDYEDRLKKAGLFNANRTKLTSDELKVLEILEAQHTAKLQEISYNEWVKASEKANRDVLAARKQMYLQDLNEAGNNVAKRKAIEEKYKDDVNTIELGQLETKRARIAEALVDIQSKYASDNETRKQLEKKFGDEALANKQAIEDKKNGIIEKGLSDEDKFRQERDAARKEYNLVSLVEQEQMEMDALKAKYEKELITDEEYAQASNNIKLKYAEDYVKLAQQLLTSLSSSVEGMQSVEITNSQTKYQTQLNQLEDSHNKGLISDKAYNTKKTELEKKQQEDEKKIKKKYADIDFAVKVAQIIASTALSIMQGYAQLGPIGGTIAAVLLGVLGGVQVAQANAQRNQVKSLASGQYNVTAMDGQPYNNVPYIGPADTGLYTKPTLIAERGPEMVISAPHVRNLQMNYPAILNAIMATRVPQRADGYYPVANQQPTTNNQSTDQSMQVMAAVVAVVNRLNDHLDKGLATNFNMHEFKTIKEAQWNAQQSDVTKS